MDEVGSYLGPPPTTPLNLRRDLLLEEIETLNKQHQRIERDLSRRAQQAPAVWNGLRMAEAVDRLRRNYSTETASLAQRIFYRCHCADCAGRARILGSRSTLTTPYFRIS